MTEDRNAAERMRRYRARQRGEDVPRRKPGPVPQAGLDMTAARAAIEASTDVAFLTALDKEAGRCILRMQEIQSRAERRIGQLLAETRPEPGGDRRSEDFRSARARKLTKPIVRA